jgi:hypothetical protein
MDFSSWYTLIPQKTDHSILFFIGAHGEWRSHFVVSQHKAKLCDDAEHRLSSNASMLKLSTSGDKGAICYHARAESSTANPHKIKTAVRILFDSPMYVSHRISREN